MIRGILSVIISPPSSQAAIFAGLLVRSLIRLTPKVLNVYGETKLSFVGGKPSAA